jgi:hypothetical protein
MYVYYPLSDVQDIILDCSGNERNGTPLSFPSIVIDGMGGDTQNTKIPVSSYFSFSGTSTITIPNFVMPNNFTITFWINIANSPASPMYIFRNDTELSIYINSSGLNIAKGSTINTIPIAFGSWTFCSIRQGVANKIVDGVEVASSANVLFIETSAINNTTPTTYTKRTNAGPTATLENTDFTETEFNLNYAGSSSYTGTFIPMSGTAKTFIMLQAFSGIISEFRVWDSLLPEYKIETIQRGSYVYRVTGDLTSGSTEVETQIESVREVNKADGTTLAQNQQTFMHAQSVSTLSTHIEIMKGSLFPLTVFNESFIPTVANISKFSSVGGTLGFETIGGNQIMKNTSNGTSSSVVFTEKCLKENHYYFVRFVGSYHSSDSALIGLQIGSSSDKKAYTGQQPKMDSDFFSHFVFHTGEGEEYLEIIHTYTSSSVSNSLYIKDLLIIEMTENKLFAFLEEIGYPTDENKSFWFFVSTYSNFLYTGNGYENYYREQREITCKAFPTFNTTATNVANIANFNNVSSNALLTDNESLLENLEILYLQLSLYNPTNPYLPMIETMIEQLPIPKQISYQTGVEKYLVLMPNYITTPTFSLYNPDTISFDITGLTEGKTYFVKVCVKNEPETYPEYTITPNNWGNIRNDENIREIYTFNERIQDSIIPVKPIDGLAVLLAVSTITSSGKITISVNYDDMIPNVMKILPVYEVFITELDDLYPITYFVDKTYAANLLFGTETALALQTYISGLPYEERNLAFASMQTFIDAVIINRYSPYFIPINGFYGTNSKPYQAEFYPMSRRKNYTANNIAKNLYNTTPLTITSYGIYARTDFYDFPSNFDSADSLIYISMKLKNNSSFSVNATILARDITGSTIGFYSGDTTGDALENKTLLAGETKVFSLAIHLGWIQPTASKTKIGSITISANASTGEQTPVLLEARDFVICNLTHDGITQWLDDMSFSTDIYKKPNGFIYSSALEKKLLWCDTYLQFEKFVDRKATYSMLNPMYTLKSEEAIHQGFVDTAGATGHTAYINSMTDKQILVSAGLQEDSPITEVDFFPVGWIHRSGNLSGSLSLPVRYGVGLVSGKLTEIKDI